MAAEKGLPVILTGIGGGGHGEQILKALRLAATKYHIIGTDIDGRCANRHKVDEFVIAPRATDPSYLDFVIGLGRKHGAVVLFHGSEPEMMVFSQAKAALEAEGFYVPVNPLNVMDLCQDKVQTSDFLHSAGFAVPHFARISTQDDLRSFDRFPAVLKPSVGGGGSANVFIAQTSEELDLFGSYMLTLGQSFIVQEYVGTADSEYTVGVLCGKDGVLINSIAIRRIINNALSIRTRVPNRSSNRSLGDHLVVSTGISQGEVGDWKEILVPCEKIVTQLGARAPVNVQCRFVDGQVVPFEINPRFSGTTSLRALAGYNEPDILVRRDVLGEEIQPHFTYDSITILRSLEENVVG